MTAKVVPLKDRHFYECSKCNAWYCGGCTGRDGSREEVADKVACRKCKQQYTGNEKDLMQRCENVECTVPGVSCNYCLSEACGECARAICPHGCFEHFFDGDGCPVCSFAVVACAVGSPEHKIESDGTIDCKSCGGTMETVLRAARDMTPID